MSDALKVEQWPIERLVEYARNPRKNDEHVDRMVGAIREFGFRIPIVAKSDGLVVDGHLRLKAARKMGLANVPVALADDLTEAQIKAFRLLANKSASWASWDDDLLALEISELGAADFDLSLVGFSDDELAAILADRTAGLTDPDDVPPTPDAPVSVLGDVWTLGRHRLVCGDATSAADVALLTQGVQADLCFTSPPYLRQRDYETGVGDWDALMQGVFANLPVKPEAQLLVNLGMVHRDGEWLPYWDGWIAWMREQGWRRFGWYVWDQGPGLPGDWNGRLAPAHEWIFHFNHVAERARKTHQSKHAGEIHKGKGLRAANGVVGPSTVFGKPYQATKIGDSVIRVLRQHGSIGVAGDHPAVFPADLVSEMLTAFSDPDDVVYEPMCGSGTQLISAQKNGRTCLAMEIAPRYVDVALLRWQNFTGQQATHALTGRSFADTAAERAPTPAEAA
jgi:DNA modification methylase